MGINKKYDFSGWATKNDLRCSDGRIIRRGAFKINDGQTVPLVWNHQHNSPGEVLGHAMLENRNDGVYAYGSFNNSTAGQNAKEAVKHGDVKSLSIWANNLEQNGPDVLHGVIREVSLVLAGANPGAFIESVLAHGEPMDDFDDEAIIHTGDEIVIKSVIAHADTTDNNKSDDQKSNKDDSDESDKTVGEIFDTLTDEQKTAVAIIVSQAVADSKENEENNKGVDEMGHSIFDTDGRNNQPQTRVLSHADGLAIIEVAKERGSLKKAFDEFTQGENVIIHAVPMQGMTGPSEATKTYGVNGMDLMLPDYRNQNMPPEFISRDMGWVGKVLAGVHKLPYERIRSMYADITEEDARAKGYIKGTQKWPEVFSILTRSVSGQTVYKLQKLDHDDIMEITEFELVPWIKREMDIMLDEEKARAILIGDGRLATDRFKIKEDRIIPIVKDVPLFNIRIKVTVNSTDSMAVIADTLIDKIIRARKKYKGSGEPSFYTTEDVITEMLSLKDKIGHKIYKTMQELATALRVKEIVPVEPMSGYKIDGDELVGVIVNLTDYAVGQNAKAGRQFFDDFDINFNQHTYLKEERFSGALRKPFSAITITLSGGTLSTDEDEKSSDDEGDEG